MDRWYLDDRPGMGHVVRYWNEPLGITAGFGVFTPDNPVIARPDPVLAQALVDKLNSLEHICRDFYTEDHDNG